MITVVGIDPGTAVSAYVGMEGSRLECFGMLGNDDMLARLDYLRISSDAATVLVIEMVSSYGMPVGDEVFETCSWIGRFIERWRGRHEKIKRGPVKINLCHSSHASDSNVRAALIERYGGKQAAIGNKKSPGPLYRVGNDVWSALAVALTYQDRADVGSGKGLLR